MYNQSFHPSWVLYAFMSVCLWSLQVGISGVCAQEVGMADSVYAIAEVSVLSDRAKDIVPAQSLTGERLQSLNSFSVADAIRYFSGVQIKDYGGVGGLLAVIWFTTWKIRDKKFYEKN